jgi:hypothetical protein
MSLRAQTFHKTQSHPRVRRLNKRTYGGNFRYEESAESLVFRRISPARSGGECGKVYSINLATYLAHTRFLKVSLSEIRFLSILQCHARAGVG